MKLGKLTYYDSSKNFLFQNNNNTLKPKKIKMMFAPYANNETSYIDVLWYKNMWTTKKQAKAWGQ